MEEEKFSDINIYMYNLSFTLQYKTAKAICYPLDAFELSVRRVVHFPSPLFKFHKEGFVGLILF